MLLWHGQKMSAELAFSSQRECWLILGEIPVLVLLSTVCFDNCCLELPVRNIVSPRTNLRRKHTSVKLPGNKFDGEREGVRT